MPNIAWDRSSMRRNPWSRNDRPTQPYLPHKTQDVIELIIYLFN